MEEPARPQAWRQHGPALAGYVLLTAVWFWPVVSHLRTRLIGDAGDASAYAWNLWALPRAVLEGHNPFNTTDIFFPVGAHTAFNTNMPLLSFLSWPLQKLFGLSAAVNLVQLAAVVLSGFAAYLLVHHLTGEREAAFVAGAAFTLVPFRMLHLGHYDLSHLEFLPFGLLALLRLYEAQSQAAHAAAVGGTPPVPRARRRALVFGLVVGLTFLVDLYYFVFLLIAAAVVAAWRWRETLQRVMAVRFAEAGAVAGVVALPLAIPMARELLVYHSLDPLVEFAGADSYSANLFSWVTPSVSQRVWGTLFDKVNARWTGGERLAFPGFTILLLAAGAIVAGFIAWRRKEQPRSRSAGVGLWVAVAGVFVLLSFGPFLHLGSMTGSLFRKYNTRFSFPMPYLLMHEIPILNGVRVPGRFSVVGILALDVLAALALIRLAARWPRWRRVVPAVALALVLVEFFPRGSVAVSSVIPKPYAAIAADPGRGAVMELPLQWRTGFGDFGDTQGGLTVFMYYATRYDKPFVGGMVARYPMRSRRALLNHPIYSQVMALQDGDLASATFGVDDLRQSGIGYVVYHRDRERPAVLAYLSELGLPVLADDGTVLVWKVP